MADAPRGLFDRLVPLISRLEPISLVIISAGLVFQQIKQPSANVWLITGISILAGTTFLRAYVPIEAHGPDEQAESIERSPRKGFEAILPLILTKVICIGGAVTLLAFVFGIMHSPGAGRLFITGTPSLVIGLILLLVIILRNNQIFPYVRDVFYRGLVILAIASCYMYVYWPVLMRTR